MSCTSVDIKDLLGTKFTVHGRSKAEGFDCLGLVIEVYRRAGISFPDVFYTNTDDRKVAEKIKVLSNAKVLEKPEFLCIILMEINNRNHVGVYLENGMMIHATRGFGVVIEPIRRYQEKIKGVYKVTN